MQEVGNRYCGPFDILNMIGLMEYEIALPPTVKYHNFFHLYLFKKYVHESNHVIDWVLIQVDPKEHF